MWRIKLKDMVILVLLCLEYKESEVDEKCPLPPKLTHSLGGSEYYFHNKREFFIVRQMRL